MHNLAECRGPLTPEMVWETLEDEDIQFTSNSTSNHWIAKSKYTGHGFTLKVDSCKRWISGFWIKNIGARTSTKLATRAFSVYGSSHGNSSWEKLVEAELDDTREVKAELLNFTFNEAKEIQFLRFDLISLWGSYGGLQYFSPILGN